MRLEVPGLRDDPRRRERKWHGCFRSCGEGRQGPQRVERGRRREQTVVRCVTPRVGPRRPHPSHLNPTVLHPERGSPGEGGKCTSIYFEKSRVVVEIFTCGRCSAGTIRGVEVGST